MNELNQKRNSLTSELSAETTQFLPIFCPVKEKAIKIICKLVTITRLYMELTLILKNFPSL